MKTRTATAAERNCGCLERGLLLEHGRRVSGMQAPTLDEMLCNHGAARSFRVGMARKTKQPPAVLQREDDFASDMLDVGDFAPGDAQIERSAEFEPSARE